MAFNEVLIEEGCKYSIKILVFHSSSDFVELKETNWQVLGNLFAYFSLSKVIESSKNVCSCTSILKNVNWKNVSLLSESLIHNIGSRLTNKPIGISQLQFFKNFHF